METKLLELIIEYQKKVKKAFELLKKTYTPIDIHPMEAKSENIIPKKGSYVVDQKKISYTFHGIGCEVIVDDEVIDFDFIQLIDEKVIFHELRLVAFCNMNKDKRPLFIDIQINEIKSMLEELIYKGKVSQYADYPNYYILL